MTKKTGFNSEQVKAIEDQLEQSGLDESRKERMRQKLMKTATLEMEVVRAPEKDWEDLMPGIQLKMLHRDDEAGIQVALWRMAPGSRIPAHPHAKDEECYLIDGSLEHAGKHYKAGDFMLAPAGSRHGTISSRDGVTMLIRGEVLSIQARMLLRAALALGR